MTDKDINKTQYLKNARDRVLTAIFGVYPQPKKSTSHIAHMGCDTKSETNDIPEEREVQNVLPSNLYRLDDKMDFVIVDVVRHPTSGTVTYRLNHIPTGQYFYISKSMFDFLFVRSVKLS